MKKMTTTTRNTKLRFWKKALSVITIQALLIVMMGSIGATYAQQQNFTFMGDYDHTFAAPNGYYVDPEDVDPTVDDIQTVFNSGEFLADGSIIAGGRHYDGGSIGGGNDFYLRKFTPTGAVDASFGTNGMVRTNFYVGYASPGAPLIHSNDLPQVLKVQPDGKILLAGQCNIYSPGVPPFGADACLIRYDPNGSIDTSFGNVSVMTGGGLSSQGTQNPTFSFEVGEGRFITQTGVLNYAGNPGPRRGTFGTIYDMAIQPDGKIVLVGDTGNEYGTGDPSNPFYSQVAAFIMRLNANGTRDDSFGTNGIVQMAAAPAFTGCYPYTSFQGMRLQADGRIIAVGYTSFARAGDCYQGKRFVVTRWTASGQAESLRHLDNNPFAGQTERATSAFFSRDGSKILVSGSYNCKATLVRLNVADLSVDTTFGTNGIRGYAQGCGGFPGFGTTLYIKAIQPDGKIIGIDNGSTFRTSVRFNPDGSSDQSFGNAQFEGQNPAIRGRLHVFATNFNGVSNLLEAGDLLVRPNGRINLIGHSAAHAGLGILRAAVSQQNTVFENGIYSDFENDGKTDFSVFRDGEWYWLNSTNNQFNSVQFGIAGDKPAPADYDGDGKTDIAVFRDGAWYILRSSNGQVSSIGFGTTDDLPRPGDFDGDGLADICVFRPSSGVWYILRSSDGGISGVQFGTNGDVPLLADFDGDGRSDISVFRNGIWYWLRSSDGGFEFVQLGTTGDFPVVGDYNGDSKSDPAVFRPLNGTWYTSLNPATNYGAVQFGQNGDVPVPGDYDNDGRHDLAVYRDGSWYVLRSGDNQVVGAAFGLSTDTPIPAAYLH